MEKTLGKRSIIGYLKQQTDAKEPAERPSLVLGKLITQLVRSSELEKKTKDRQRREKDTAKTPRLQSDLGREKVKIEKLRDSSSSVGLTIDQIMNANNILDSVATSPRFLEDVRDRLETREKCSNSPKRKRTLDDLLLSNMSTDHKIYGDLDTTLEASHGEGFLQIVNTQLSVEYDALTRKQKVLNDKLRMAEDEKRLRQVQLEDVESNIADLKAKLADVTKDWKMLDDFGGLVETYKKQK